MSPRITEFKPSKFDETAASRFYYRGREHQQQQHEAAVSAAGDLRGKSVVDVGCGYGDLLYRLPHGVRYVGIERSEEAVLEARRLHPGREFHVTDVCPSGDVVFAIATLQQSVPDPVGALRSWWEAAREVLVLTTVVDEKLSWSERGLDPWAGLPEPEITRSDDDWYVAVLRK